MTLEKVRQKCHQSRGARLFAQITIKMRFLFRTHPPAAMAVEPQPQHSAPDAASLSLSASWVYFYCHGKSIFIYCRAHSAIPMRIRSSKSRLLRRYRELVCALRMCCSSVCVFADVRVYYFRQFKFIIIGESICWCVGPCYGCVQLTALSYSSWLR